MVNKSSYELQQRLQQLLLFLKMGKHKLNNSIRSLKGNKTLLLLMLSDLICSKDGFVLLEGKALQAFDPVFVVAPESASA